MRCETQRREGKGAPWIQCSAEATVMLIHKGRGHKYCAGCAASFISAFPTGTFERRELSDVRWIKKGGE